MVNFSDLLFFPCRLILSNQIQKILENPYEPNQIVLTGVWPATSYPAGDLDEKR